MKKILRTIDIYFWMYAFGAPVLYLLLPAREIWRIALCVLGLSLAYIAVCYRDKINLYNYKLFRKVLKCFLLIAVPLVHLVIGFLMDFAVIPHFQVGLL